MTYIAPKVTSTEVHALTFRPSEWNESSCFLRAPLLHSVAEGLSKGRTLTGYFKIRNLEVHWLVQSWCENAFVTYLFIALQTQEVSCIFFTCHFLHLHLEQLWPSLKEAMHWENKFNIFFNLQSITSEQQVAVLNAVASDRLVGSRWSAWRTHQGGPGSNKHFRQSYAI